jgi:hypothetical protein
VIVWVKFGFNFDNFWKNIISQQSAIGKQVALTGVMKRSFEADFINMFLSISRFTIWKRRNSWKFDKCYISELACFRWIVDELKNNCKVLMKTKKVMYEKKVMGILEKAVFVTIHGF